ncbi:hypothetical protein HZU77_015795 [Neisseriaceae bacterium TC5R-5]|nr:hypothetical protein [Neisseriaceae bacterium TC5R-5]
MMKNASRIEAWAKSSPLRDLDITENFGKILGHGVIRSSGKLVPMNKAIIILKCKKYNGMPYFILTAYLDL